MKTATKITANIDELQFGYWDMDTERFVPVDAQYVDKLQKAVTKLGVPEELIDALALFAANITSAVRDDLEDIWKRLDRVERSA